jgi:hypothetical protein
MASKASTHGRQCENNPDHWLDPTWTTCPYCEAEKRSKQQTKVAQSSNTTGSQRKNPTVVSPGPDSTQKSKSKTKVMPGQGSERAYIPPVKGKRLVAVLVTYKSPHEHEGRVYPIYEGKTLISALEPCDILIDDNQMSDKHTSIRYLHGKFEIIDNHSTNGVNVNGEWIPDLQGYPLENYAKIITGQTEWTFIITAISGPPDVKTQQPEKEPEKEQPAKRDNTKLY